MRIIKPSGARQNFAWDEFLSLGSIVLTVASYAMIYYDQFTLFSANLAAGEWANLTGLVVFTLIMSMFAYAIIVYHIARLRYYRSLRQSKRRARQGLEPALPLSAPEVTILVPSYCEEVGVIWQTLMSAALLDYPNRRLVLLLDNPPNPREAAEQKLLRETRLQIGAIQALFAPIAERFALTSGALLAPCRQEGADGERLRRGAAALYREAAAFLESIAQRIGAGEFGGPDNHVRRFFIDNMLLTPARLHSERAQGLLTGRADMSALNGELQRLARMFRFEIAAFERKGFGNLTHAPNKASNLNAYIGLMGGKYRIERRAGANWLENAAPGEKGELAPRDAPFIVILDADSFMHPDYLTKTVAAMLAPGNERIAVAQTPYKAIPGSPSLLERTAGASTDVHYCVAQGMSAAGAGFWVGATALVRMSALRDIAEPQEEAGLKFTGFIPDKTLIEDADATVRLATRGWRIHHLPEHLNWSSTPADFGSLVIQRRRWANGGLLILPTLIRYLRASRWSPALLLEAFLRIYHLLAAPITGVAGLAILIYPFDTSLASKWVSLALVPYLYLHGRDLKRQGYVWADLFRIFALNIILLPVVLAGVLNSVQQLIYGRKIPFARTPKIEHRTAAPAFYLLAALALNGWNIHTFVQAVKLDLRGQAFPSFFCAIALAYAIMEFIGFWPLVIDIAIAGRNQIAAAAASSLRWLTPAPARMVKAASGAK